MDKRITELKDGVSAGFRKVAKFIYALPLLLLGVAIVGGFDFKIGVGDAMARISGQMPVWLGYALMIGGIWLLVDDLVVGLVKAGRKRLGGRGQAGEEKSIEERVREVEKSR